MPPVGRDAFTVPSGRGTTFACDADYGLRLEVAGLHTEIGVVLRVELYLRDAFAVAQIDEDNAAVVADGVHPIRRARRTRRDRLE